MGHRRDTKGPRRSPLFGTKTLEEGLESHISLVSRSTSGDCLKVATDIKRNQKTTTNDTKGFASCGLPGSHLFHYCYMTSNKE